MYTVYSSGGSYCIKWNSKPFSHSSTWTLSSPYHLLSPALWPQSRLDVQISTANKVYLQLLQPYLSVMLNKGSLEVLVFTGSHSPRRVTRRPEQGVLNDGREHSLRIERLPGRSVCVCSACVSYLCNSILDFYSALSTERFLFVFVCFPPDLLQFRWTRRPRGRQRFPTTSQWACSASSSVVFLQKLSRRPTGPTSHSRDVYGTSWSTLCT